MWTEFMDMHSGGDQKEDWGHIFIEAPLKIAKIVFYNRFGHNPNRITCTCCGEDYSISEAENLLQATACERGCQYDSKLNKYIDKPSTGFAFKTYQTLDEYINSGKAHFIYAKDIKPEEKTGELPQQGYVWVD